ncbi:uncharacterized protein [Drosophila kikkawai]|uniref:Uncharacterized protein n=1 Tax=Drosophila kikkawai TaxID=30033 RepID=A0ABM4GPM2_DROKI
MGFTEQHDTRRGKARQRNASASQWHCNAAAAAAAAAASSGGSPSDTSRASCSANWLGTPPARATWGMTTTATDTTPRRRCSAVRTFELLLLCLSEPLAGQSHSQSRSRSSCTCLQPGGDSGSGCGCGCGSGSGSGSEVTPDLGHGLGTAVGNKNPDQGGGTTRRDLVTDSEAEPLPQTPAHPRSKEQASHPGGVAQGRPHEQCNVNELLSPPPKVPDRTLMSRRQVKETEKETETKTQTCPPFAVCPPYNCIERRSECSSNLVPQGQETVKQQEVRPRLTQDLDQAASHGANDRCHIVQMARNRKRNKNRDQEEHQQQEQESHKERGWRNKNETEIVRLAANTKYYQQQMVERQEQQQEQEEQQQQDEEQQDQPR